MAIKSISAQAAKVTYLPFYGKLIAANDNTPPDQPPSNAMALRAAA